MRSRPIDKARQGGRVKGRLRPRSMTDLVWSIVCWRARPAGSCGPGGGWGGRAPRAGRAAAVMVLMLLVVFALLLHGRLLLARLVPATGAIVLANWIPLGAGFLVGVVMAERAVPVWRARRRAECSAALGWYTVAAALVAPAAETGAPVYSNGVPLQTNPTSCSAVAATAVLREHVITASEREMVELCLTGRRHAGVGPVPRAAPQDRWHALEGRDSDGRSGGTGPRRHAAGPLAGRDRASGSQPPGFGAVLAKSAAPPVTRCCFTASPTTVRR